MHAFDVLGDPVRRRILELLGDSAGEPKVSEPGGRERAGKEPGGREISAGEISAIVEEEFGISQPAVSRHLRVLRETGFATSRVDRQRRLYALEPEPFNEVDAWLDRYGRSWRRATTGPRLR